MTLAEARRIAGRVDAHTVWTPAGLAEAASVMAATLTAIEIDCNSMNRGAPGWTLRDKILKRINEPS